MMSPRSKVRGSASCATRVGYGGVPAAPGRTLREAFTLLEIMIVVGIMGIILAMGVPLVYKVWHRAPMTKAISELHELCINARARAILHRTEARLVLDGAGGGIHIEGGARPAVPGGGQAAPGGGQAPAGGRESPSVVLPTGPTAITSTHLPDAVVISKFMVAGVDCMSFESASVRFFPNGTSDDFIMQLMSDRGERVEISLEVTTGLAFVEHDWNKFRIR
jgi:prepilin-type N-terminal cleavage/methylation domain-containing protein